LITLASTFSFLGGWVLLAHSLKPTSGAGPSSGAPAALPGIAATPLPTLPPLQGLDFSPSQSAQPAPPNPLTIVSQPQPPQVQAMPIFTTSGS